MKVKYFYFSVGRYHPAPRECSIMSCLNQFTAAELLTGSNKVSCKECTKAKRKNSLPKAQVNGLLNSNITTL